MRITMSSREVAKSIDRPALSGPAGMLGRVDKRDFQISLDLTQGCLLRGGVLGLSEQCGRRSMGDHRATAAFGAGAMGTAIAG